MVCLLASEMRGFELRPKVLVMLTWVFLFVGTSGIKTVMAQEEVKLGVILPFAGGLEQTGKAVRSAFELAAEIANMGAPEVNAAMARWRGVPGLGGRKIRLIVGDHRSDPERGAALASRFISEERVAGIVGCFSSSVTKAVSSVSEKARIPMLTATSTAQSLTTQGNKWLWRTCPNNVSRAGEFFSFLNDLKEGNALRGTKVPKEEIGRLCIMADATELGDQTADILKRLAQRSGIRPILHLRYPRGASDFSIQAKAAAKARPGVVAMVSSPQDAAGIVKKFRELGFSPPIIWGQGWGVKDEAFKDGLKEDAVGVASIADFSVKLANAIPLAGQINALYKDKTGRDLDDISALAFTGLQAFLYILDAARSTEPVAIQAAANSIEIPGSELIMPWRGIRFGGEQQRETGQNVLARGVVVQWQPAMETAMPGLEIVHPARYATSELIYPFPMWSE